MIPRALLRLVLPIALALILVSLFDALAATNMVATTGADDLVIPITPNDLKPPECAALVLTSLAIGSGTFTGHGGNTLILGSSGADTIKGQGGNDCIVGGGGNDNLQAQAGSDVLIGGPGADTLNGGNGTDVCYGYSGTISGGGVDTFTNCETQFP
jgi:Ca2+-binding RTX toxin-like protein